MWHRKFVMKNLSNVGNQYTKTGKILEYRKEIKDWRENVNERETEEDGYK